MNKETEARIANDGRAYMHRICGQDVTDSKYFFGYIAGATSERLLAEKEIKAVKRDIAKRIECMVLGADEHGNAHIPTNKLNELCDELASTKPTLKEGDTVIVKD